MSKLFSINTILLILISISMFSCQSSVDREYYQLSKYQFDSASQMTAMDAYLKSAYLPALKRQGVKNIGVFKNQRNQEDSTFSIYVLAPYSSLEQIQSSKDQLMQDAEYLTASVDFSAASNEEAPYRRQMSIVLRAFVDRPLMNPSKLTGPRGERIYELRSYESATEAKYWNKVDMFNAGDEVGLFDKLGFNAVFYGEVLSGPTMPNLMYMTTFENQNSRDEHWKAFVESQEWKALKSNPEYQNNVSHMDIYFLYPTEYSDY